MFHYRWHDKVDADNAGTILPLQTLGALPDDMFFYGSISSGYRQIGNAVAWPVAYAIGKELKR